MVSAEMNWHGGKMGERVIACVLLALLSHLGANSVQATLHVAFFKWVDTDGKLVQIEPDGKFGHVAIAYEDKWLHAHVFRGVELADSLEKIGIVSEVLKLDIAAPLTAEEIEPLLGLPYDRLYLWQNPEGTYCSKLVGKLLGLTPKPMSFSTSYWKQFKKLPPKDEPGLSPDDVYEALIKSGYKPADCKTYLASA